MAGKAIVTWMPKGGTGKTATAVTFSHGLQRLGKRVLLVDLDMQNHATMGCGVDQLTVEYAVKHFLMEPGRPFKPIEIAPGFDLVPGSMESATLDIEARHLASLYGGLFVVRHARDRVLDRYDYVIFDCSPHPGDVTMNALAAGPVLAPVDMTRVGVSSVAILLDALSFLRKGIAPHAGVAAYLPARVPATARREFDEAMGLLRKYAADTTPILKNYIPEATHMAQALGSGQSIFSEEFVKVSKAPAAYAAAIDEFLPHLDAYYGAAPSGAAKLAAI